MPGPANVGRLSCSEAPCACGSSGTPLAAFALDAFASGVTQVRLAPNEPLQRRARQTARRQLLAAVRPRRSMHKLYVRKRSEFPNVRVLTEKPALVGEGYGELRFVDG
jgi:hypothetical protein